VKDRIRVLYVDGESSLPAKGKAFLEKKGGFALDTCASPPAALELLQHTTYDAVVSGYRMPEMEGIEFLKRVRAADPAIPFIMITGHGSEKAAMEALNNGADQYLKTRGETDTFSADLCQIIRRSVRKRRGLAASGEPVQHRDAGTIPAAKGLLQGSDLPGGKEQVLQGSEETFRAMVEQSGEGMIIVDFFGMLRYANQKAWDIIEYPPDQRSTENFNVLDIVAPEMRVSAVRDFLQVSRGIDSYLVNYKIITPEKAEKWIECIGKKISYHGSPSMLLSFRDITARMKTDYRLRESEEKFRTIFENSPYPIAINSIPDGRFIAVNPAFLNSSGFTEAEVIGKSPFELGMLSLMDFGRLTANLLKSGRIENVPLALTGKNGKRVHVQFSTIPVTINNQHAILTMTAEITKVKRIEEELLQKNEDLQESEERLALVMNGVPTMISYHDPQMRFVYSNKAHQAWFGLSGKDLTGKSLKDLLPGEAFRRALPYYEKVLAGQEVSFENPTRDKDGRPRILNVRLVPHLHDSKVIGFFAALEDITDRKQTEAALVEEITKRKILVDQSRDGIVTLDESGRVYEANRRFAEMLGYAPEEIQKLHVWDWDDQFSREQILEMIRTISPEGAHFETRHRRKDGTVIDVELSNSAATFSGKKLIFCVVRDITERKNAEAAFQAIVSSMVGTTGMESLDRITENVASWLGADCVMVGEILPDRERVRVLSMILDGKHITDFLYTLKGSPCENVTEKGYCCYPEHAVSIFPMAKDMVELNIQGYVGTPLRSAEGLVVGILCVLTRRPFKAPPALQEIIDLIAVKAAAEIERRNALQALGESEEHYRLLAEQVHDGIFILQENRFVFVNSLISGITGYSKDELLSMDFLDLVHPDDRTYIRGIADRRARGELVPDVYELRIVRKDGSVRFAELAVSPIVYRGRYAAIGAGRDITERKKAEEALRESQQMLSEAMDLAQLANWEYDVNGGVFIFDDRFYAMFGTTAEREGGNRMPADVYAREFIHPDDRAALREEMEKAQKSTAAHYVAQREHRIVRRDGEIRHVVVRIEVSKDAQGQVVKARGVNQDITDRKKAEEALRESEQHYRSLAEQVHDGIFIYHGNRFIFVNSLICQLTGYPKDELLTMDFFDLVHPDDRTYVRGIAERRARGEKVPDVYELRIVRKDGAVRFAELALSMISFRGSYAVLGAGRDITERREAEEALRQANRKLTMLNSITRHDILNQLTALLGYLAFSKEDITDPRILEYIEKEDQAAKAIRSQIEFSRNYQEIGTQEPRWQALSEVIGAGIRQLERDGVAIDADVDGVEVFADPLLEKVFYNLMENSLRHGEHVTRMNFSCRKTESGLVVTYSDDGAGITAKDKKNLFKRGFGKHTGLGLFLSKEILAITGITIAENGEPGKGVRFEITVPDGTWRRAEPGTTKGD